MFVERKRKAVEEKGIELPNPVDGPSPHLTT
jgi:hypothetical protein